MSGRCIRVPGTLVRLACLPRPTKWSLDFHLMTSQMCLAVAVRDPGGVAAAVVDLSGACSAAAGFFPARQFAKALVARTWDVWMAQQQQH